MISPISKTRSGRRCSLVIRACAVAAMAVMLCSGSVGNADAVVVRQAEWPLNDQHFHADGVWKFSRGEGVTVAVIDSGVDSTHPDLAGQVMRGAGFIGDSQDTGQDDTSSDSHGTAIAGIIAGTGAANSGSGMIGLAPKSKILPVRVATQSAAEPTAIAQGIKYAADHRAQIINISLGTQDPDPVLRQAVDYAMSKDCVVVASAGNDGENGDPPMYPAAFPGVVDVTGVDEYGLFWPMSESSSHTTIAAPATDIYSTNNQNQYVDADGTSYATAYVSATAALVRSSSPRLTAAQTIERLIGAADTPKHHSDQQAEEYGYGVLDPLASVKSTAGASTRVNPLLSPRSVKDAAPDHTVLWTSVIVAVVSSATCLSILVIRRRRNTVKGGRTQQSKTREPRGRSPARSVGKSTHPIPRSKRG